MKRYVIAIMFMVVFAGCEDKVANNSDSEVATVLASDEAQLQDELNEETEITEAEITEITNELEESGLTEEELSVAPSPVYYSKYNRIMNRLSLLEDSLGNIYDFYKELPPRLQSVIKPWVQLYLKHAHLRLELLKTRVINHIRSTDGFMVCIKPPVQLEPFEPNSLGVVEVEESSSAAAATLKVDEEGVVYAEIEAQVSPPYICAENEENMCEEICRDNYHLAKRILRKIEALQSGIERFIAAIN